MSLRLPLGNRIARSGRVAVSGRVAQSGRIQQSFTPADIPSLALWLRGDLGVTLNGSTVSAWADQSGNGYNFSQSTASAQPTYNLTSANFKSQPTLQSDGGNTLASTLVNLAGAKTIFCVYRLVAVPGSGTAGSLFTLANSTETLYSETLAINTIGGYQAMTFKHGFQANAASVGHALTLNTSPRILEQTYNGGTITSVGSYAASLEGTAQTIVTSGNVARSIGELSSIFGRSDSAGAPSSSLSQMEIAELIVYSREISRSARMQLRRYASLRYGISAIYTV